MSAGPHRGARRVAVGALLLWGVIHIVGGGAEIATARGDGGQAALELLGSAADPGDIPDEPGAVAEAIVAFHGFLVASAGLAVAALTVGLVRSGRPPTLLGPLAVVAVADLGLLLFMVVPGHMAFADAVWGPLLFVVALAGASRARLLTVERAEAAPLVPS